MCTVVILRRPGHNWPLLFAANRDEMAARPWLPPARHWPDRPRVVAGQDTLAGGTWLALSDLGVIAGVLNRPGSLGPAPGLRSRGELPLEALEHATAADAAEALTHIEPRSYRTFNLVVADAMDAFWVRSAEDGSQHGVTATPVPEGLSMITAHDMNDDASSRIRRHRRLFEQAPAPDPETGDWSAWQKLMASRDSDAGPEGAMTIVTDTGFGTVSSSLLALPKRGRKGVKPRFLFAAGRPDQAPYGVVSL
ncbi:MAG: NRDE family protein [Rhodospirillales bacterium]|nr:NRDE family protein [Rhodospirillales bacterium]